MPAPEVRNLPHNPPMTSTLKKLWAVAFETFKGWKGDRCNGMGAGLAFFSLLGFSSLFILTLLLSQKLWGVSELKTRVLPFLGQWLDPRWSSLLRYLVTETKQFKLTDTAVTVPTLIFAALSVDGIAEQMRGSIQAIWGQYVSEVSPKEFIREKLWAIAIPLMMASWMVLGIHLRVFTRTAFGLDFSARLSWSLALFELIGTGIYWGIFIAILYKCLAPVKLSWREVAPGAMITSFLMAAGRTFVDKYLVSKNVANTTSLAGHLLAFLILAYFYSQLFLIGAELTRVLSRHWERKQKQDSPLNELIA
jgi:membrane protein